MISIANMIENAKKLNYNELNAEAKVCQDIILILVANSKYNRNITVKGGVVMRNITDNFRRATLDMDLDFIKYSLDDDSIDRFIASLNNVEMVSVKRIGNIEELRQQDYHGKRVYVEITDKTGYSLKSKIDLGVHTHFDISQDEFCFDLGIDGSGASLLVNSKEQMLTEKLRSILKFGQFSTRYKDVFDIYYLFDLVDKNKLNNCFKILIYDDVGMKEDNITDIIKRLKNTFSNQLYLRNLNTSKKNWLEIDTAEILNGIIDYFKSLENI